MPGRRPTARWQKRAETGRDRAETGRNGPETGSNRAAGRKPRYVWQDHRTRGAAERRLDSGTGQNCSDLPVVVVLLGAE